MEGLKRHEYKVKCSVKTCYSDLFFFGQIMFPGNQIHDLGIATSQATVY